MAESLVVAVVGQGTMGAAIARLFASANHDVRVFDAIVEAPPQFGIHSCASVGDAVVDADVVFEAITEDLDAKHGLLDLIEALNPRAVIASTTSTFTASQLARSGEQRERTLVAHFFNPADVVPLVEMSATTDISPRSFDTVKVLLESAGKVVVCLEREVDGFIANRLQAALIREAIALWQEGVASPKDIDLVLTECLGPRWSASGCFEIMDLGGLDVWSRVSGRLVPDLDIRDRVTPILDEMVRRGFLGAKAGVGFFDYPMGAREQILERITKAFDRKDHR